MKARIPLALAILLILLMASSVPAAAGGATVPFKAFYSMHPQILGFDPNGCMIQQFPGEGEATHLGESTWYSDAKSCPGTWIQWGDATWTAANGDQLFGGFSGEFRIVTTADGSIAEYWGTYYMDRGTGRFEGYSGTGDYWGTATFTGTGDLHFEGTLTKP